MIAERLNDLLELEACGIAARLGEVHSFVDPRDADALALFRRIHADHCEHQRLLSEAIVRAGGVPRPTSMDMATAGDHYLGARCLTPKLIEEQRRCIAACDRAAGEVSADGDAASVVATILKDHRRHLEQLESFARRLQAAEAETMASAAQADDA